MIGMAGTGPAMTGRNLLSLSRSADKRLIPQAFSGDWGLK